MQARAPNAKQQSRQRRKGKWTVEEEEYTARIIHHFSTGLLTLPEGTTLRAYLAERLNCDPMRITKKFTGAAMLGKRIFHQAERTPERVAEMAAAQEELRMLEERFLARLERSMGPHQGVFVEWDSRCMDSATVVSTPAIDAMLRHSRDSMWLVNNGPPNVPAGAFFKPELEEALPLYSSAPVFMPAGGPGAEGGGCATLGNNAAGLSMQEAGPEGQGEPAMGAGGPVSILGPYRPGGTSQEEGPPFAPPSGPALALMDIGNLLQAPPDGHTVAWGLDGEEAVVKREEGAGEEDLEVEGPKKFRRGEDGSRMDESLPSRSSSSSSSSASSSVAGGEERAKAGAEDCEAVLMMGRLVTSIRRSGSHQDLLDWAVTARQKTEGQQQGGRQDDRRRRSASEEWARPRPESMRGAWQMAA